jgi:hypothetical protein
MKETLINRDSKTLLLNPQDWDYIWKERDLRRAGLLGVTVEGNHASRLRVSRHDMTQAHDRANDVCDTFMAEARQQSWRTTMSSDLPGEDGNKYFSTETLTQHRLVLSQGNSQRKDTSLPEGPESHQMQQECSSPLSRSMVTPEKRMVSDPCASLALCV